MIKLLLIIICIIIYIEINIFIQIINMLGIIITLLLISITTLLGFVLIQSQIKSSLALIPLILTSNNHLFITKEIIKKVYLLISGILLLLPGLLTDIIGLLLLLPQVQYLITLYVLPYWLKNNQFYDHKHNNTNNNKNKKTFEGEYHKKNVNKK